MEEMMMRKGKMFYSVYFSMIILFFVGMACVLCWLYGWLKTYEASQPAAKCEEVFSELFTNPDWKRIYELSGTQDSIFENSELYAAYMQKKVGGIPLSLSETSAGLSGNKKYFVKLGEEKLLSFILENTTGQNEKITKWSLGEITLLYAKNQFVKIQKQQGHRTYVNGIALDDSYTISRTTTLAEKYLPEGVHGTCSEIQCVEGLMTIPDIQVIDAEGQPCEVIYDDASGIYVEQVAQLDIPEDKKQIALWAAEGYCQYMIGATKNLAAYFDTNTDIYKVIRRNETWLQDYKGYTFANESVEAYCPYSDDFFSVKVSLVLNVTRMNGTVKEYALDNSFFFRRQGNGTYLVTEMTNVDVSEPVTEVCLTYKNGNEILKSEFVKADSNKVTVPLVEAPQGQMFSGWMKEEIDKEGRKTQKLMFVPNENGEVSLPSGYVLEPMTLFPLFE